jgi:hypothetical protein
LECQSSPTATPDKRQLAAAFIFIGFSRRQQALLLTHILLQIDKDHYQTNSKTWLCFHLKSVLCWATLGASSPNAIYFLVKTKSLECGQLAAAFIFIGFSKRQQAAALQRRSQDAMVLYSFITGY